MPHQVFPFFLALFKIKMMKHLRLLNTVHYICTV